MRIRLSAVLTGMLLGLTSSALAQNPEEGETGDMGDELGDLGGDDGMGSDGTGGEGDDGMGSDDAAGSPAKPISAGLLLGYGVSLEDSNPWGVGFGIRGGYNLNEIFLGARFVYYLGESESFTDPLSAMTYETSVNIWELGIEGGYDLSAGSVVIRPGLGLGLANTSFDTPLGSDSSTDLYIAPGASVLFDVAPDIFVGADVRLKLVFAESTIKGLPLLLYGGMRF